MELANDEEYLKVALANGEVLEIKYSAYAKDQQAGRDDQRSDL